MTAIIIEDEIPGAKRLEKLLIEKKFTVLAILASVESSLKWLESNNHPDLIFMDIKLKDGNCFRILDRISIKSKIVFTTAYDEYALKAFNYNAIDYLLKPIDEGKLDKMLSKYADFRTSFQNEMDWAALEENIENQYKTSFLVASGNGVKKIETDDIICFFSDSNSSFIFTNEKRQFLINSSLDSLEQQLQPKLFFRISRKFIVNKKYITGWNNNSQIKLQMAIENNFDFIISRLKMKPFIEWYKK